MHLPRPHLMLAASSFVLMMLGIVVSDTPPACLIGIIRSYPNPADVRTICTRYQQEVTAKIAQTCSGTFGPSAAMSAFAATCLSEARIRVAQNSTVPKGYPSASIGAAFPSASTAPNLDSSKPKSSDKPIDNSTGKPADKSPAPGSTASSANFNYPTTVVSILFTIFIARFLL